MIESLESRVCLAASLSIITTPLQTQGKFVVERASVHNSGSSKFAGAMRASLMQTSTSQSRILQRRAWSGRLAAGGNKVFTFKIKTTVAAGLKAQVVFGKNEIDTDVPSSQTSPSPAQGNTGDGGQTTPADPTSPSQPSSPGTNASPQLVAGFRELKENGGWQVEIQNTGTASASGVTVTLFASPSPVLDADAFQVGVATVSDSVAPGAKLSVTPGVTPPPGTPTNYDYWMFAVVTSSTAKVTADSIAFSPTFRFFLQQDYWGQGVDVQKLRDSNFGKFKFYSGPTFVMSGSKMASTDDFKSKGLPVVLAVPTDPDSPIFTQPGYYPSPADMQINFMQIQAVELYDGLPADATVTAEINAYASLIGSFSPLQSDLAMVGISASRIVNSPEGAQAIKGAETELDSAFPEGADVSELAELTSVADLDLVAAEGADALFFL